MGSASRWPRRHPLLAAWVLVAFCARALVPAGYMPGHGGLMLCPSAGPVPAAAEMDMPSMEGMDMSAIHGMHHPAMPQGAHAAHGAGHGDTFGNEHSCPYASAVAQLAPGHEPAPAAWLAFVASDVAPPHELPLPRAPIPSSRLPRGPPASA